MSFVQLLSLSVICNVTANILLKSGITKIGGVTLTSSTIVSDLIKVALSPLIVGVLFLYGFSFIIWLRVLTFNDLSKVYPVFVTFVFILTTVGSFLLLKESVSVMRIVGIAILILGVFIVARS